MTDAYETWERESDLLARLGQAIFDQAHLVTVRLPKQLADQARGSWERDELDGESSVKSAHEAVLRRRAADLALIGLAIQERGRLEGDEVVVEIDAWQIGAALDAADEAGLIAGPTPARRPR